MELQGSSHSRPSGVHTCAAGTHRAAIPSFCRFCGMVQFRGDVRKRVLLQLLLLLCHPFPVVSGLGASSGVQACGP